MKANSFLTAQWDAVIINAGRIFSKFFNLSKIVVVKSKEVPIAGQLWVQKLWIWHPAPILPHSYIHPQSPSSEMLTYQTPNYQILVYTIANIWLKKAACTPSLSTTCMHLFSPWFNLFLSKSLRIFFSTCISCEFRRSVTKEQAFYYFLLSPKDSI